eukprot:749490-Hanusia_phi.AAC.5
MCGGGAGLMGGGQGREADSCLVLLPPPFPRPRPRPPSPHRYSFCIVEARFPRFRSRTHPPPLSPVLEGWGFQISPQGWVLLLFNSRVG